MGYLQDEEAGRFEAWGAWGKVIGNEKKVRQLLCAGAGTATPGFLTGPIFRKRQHFLFPSTGHEGFNFSTFLSTLAIVWVFSFLLFFLIAAILMHMKRCLTMVSVCISLMVIGKDPDAGRDWGQEEKGATEDEMARWHHRLDGHEFGWTLGVGDGQAGLVCCGSWGRKESDATE